MGESGSSSVCNGMEARKNRRLSEGHEVMPGPEEVVKGEAAGVGRGYIKSLAEHAKKLGFC